MSTDLVVRIVPQEIQGTEDKLKVLEFSMRKVLLAESRAEEIGALTPGKSGELMKTLNRGYLDAANIYAKLRYEKARAEQDLAFVKAEALTERVPVIIKAKSLASSADVRTALVEADEQYQDAQDRLAYIEAAMEYVKAKMKFLENAYTAVKKIMDTGNWNMALSAGRAELDGTDDEEAAVGMLSKRGSFGDPK